MKKKLLIIGSSKIVEEHIKSALKAGFKLYSLNSSRLKSKNEYRINKKYKFEKKFDNWKIALNSAFKNKSISLLLAPKFSLTSRILKYALRGNNFILVEKPVSTKISELKKLSKFNKRIYVMYNRIFYENIQFLKKNLSKISSVVVKFTDKSKKNALVNSIHIFSIIYYLFGNIKIQYSQKKRNSINMVLTTKEGFSIFVIYNNNFPETFSIDIRTNKTRYLLKPIEKLQIIKKLNFKYKNRNKKMLIPSEKVEKTLDLYRSNSFKPGFYEQMKYIDNQLKKGNKFGNFNFAIRVMEIAKHLVR